MLCTGYYGSYTNIETHCTWGLSLIALCLGIQTKCIPSTDRLPCIWDRGTTDVYILASSTSNDSSVDISLKATRLELGMYQVTI